MKQEALGLVNVTQKENGESVLCEMNLHVFVGEIFGIFALDKTGEGALIELLQRNRPMERGKVFLEDAQVNSYSHSDASRNPVFVINWRSELIQGLSVAENVFVRGSGNRIWTDRKKRDQLLDKLFQEMGAPLRPSMRAEELGPCETCVVELIRAVTAGGRLVILKELGDFLSEAEQAEFSRYVKFYAEKGVTFLQFGTSCAQLQTGCDRIALMQNGRFVKILRRDVFGANALRPFLCPWGAGIRQEVFPAGGIFQLEHVYTKLLRDYHFSVPSGQCALLAYESTQEMQALFRLIGSNVDVFSGNILLDGVPLCRKSRHKAVRQGLCLIDANPTATMVCPSLSYLDNLSVYLPMKTGAHWAWGKIHRSIRREYTDAVGSDLLRGNLYGLSRESLYNLVYYSVHLYNPKAVVILQPLEGCELSLQGRILTLIGQLKQQKIAVLLLSGSPGALLPVADSVYIARNGGLLPAPDM